MKFVLDKTSLGFTIWGLFSKFSFMIIFSLKFFLMKSLNNFVIIENEFPLEMNISKVHFNFSLIFVS